MKKNKSRKKLNNQGMSLLELLLAVLLISAVSVVFYHGFISSATTNSKSRLHHKATTLAQSIVESMKAENMDGIMHQFEYPSYTVEVEGVGVTYKNFDLLQDNIMAQASIGTFGDYATSDDGGKTAKYKATSNNKYYLFMQNLDMDGTKFDALITIDGSAYKNGGAAGQDYNDFEEAHIPVMDGNYDATINGTMAYDAAALSDLRHQAGASFSKSRIRREIIVDVDTIARGTENEYRVTATYKYTHVNIGNSATYEVTDYVFDNTMDLSKELRNVYVFFQPTAYDANGDSWMNSRNGGDIITVNNAAGAKFNLYLIKMMPVGIDQENDLAWETKVRNWDTAGYEPQIYINGPVILSANPASPVKIHTNLGYSLVNNAAIGTGVRQAVYKYNGVDYTNSAESFFGLTALTNKQKTDKIMDVIVDIYLHENEGAPSDMDDFLNNLVGEKRATMQGTIRN